MTSAPQPAARQARDASASSWPFRVAVVGAGRISRFHFAAWQAVESAAVVAVCDVDLGRAREMAERFAVPASYGSLAALLKAEQVDALDIATPPETHLDILRAAAARGIDCLCQKPLAPDYEAARRLVAEVTPRLRLMVNENRRHLPYVRKAREWIAAGLIGDLQQVTMTSFRTHYLPDAGGIHGGTPALISGSRFFVQEALIHQIDVLRSLVGPLRVVAARMLATEPELPGETLGTILMETPGGVPVALAGSNVAIGYPRRFNDRFEIFGASASLAFADGVLCLLGPDPREARFDMEDDYDAIYQSCFTEAACAFRDAIVGGTPFETDATDNLETLRLVEDAYRLSG